MASKAREELQGHTTLAEWNIIGSTDKRLIVLLASSLLYRGGKPGLE
jgi:hypothetical protein